MMDKNILYSILQYEQSLNIKDPRIKRNYYGNFLNSLIGYNKLYGTNYIITSQTYEDLFNELIKDKKIIKSCCNKFKVT